MLKRLFPRLLCFLWPYFLLGNITITSGVGGFVFVPSEVTIAYGESVTFILASNHNVESSSIPDGAAPFYAGLGATLNYVATVAGTYHYYCSPHQYLGMAGSFTVLPAPSISIGSTANTSFCGSEIAELNLTCTSIIFGGANIFKIQVSNAEGSFSTPTEIVPHLASEKYVKFTLPSSVPPGSAYRLRVVATDPAFVGTDNGVDLKINYTETVGIKIVPNPTGDICMATPVTFTAITSHTKGNIEFQWFLNNAKVSNQSVFTTSALQNGQTVFCTFTAQPAGCSSIAGIVSSDVYSATISSSILPKLSLSGLGNICNNTFTITSSSMGEGANPLLIWSIPGVDIPNNAANVVLENSQKTVLVTLISDLSCASPQQVTAIYTINPLQNVGACEQNSIIQLENILSITSNNLGVPATGFIWYKNDTFYAITTQRFIKPTVSGVFKIGFNSCCPITSSGFDFILSTLTGTMDFPTAAQNFLIFPNPAGNTLFFVSKIPYLKLEISNYSGQIKLERTTQPLPCKAGKGKWCTCPSTTELDIASLPAGVNILKVYTANATPFLLKFVKQ